MTAIVRVLSQRWLVLFCQVVIALVFLLAAITKIGDSAVFARQIHHYRILPLGLENLVAITLPWIELLLALAILLRIQPRAGSAVGAGLMALFLAIVATAVVRGLDIECGCFGTADATHVGVAKLLENSAFFVVAAIGCLAPRD